MSYNASIPGPNDLLSQSQGQIQTNFSTLSTWSAVDHVGVTTSSNTGTHQQVTFSNVTSPSTPTDPISILYTKNDSSSHPQLFFLNSQNSGQVTIGGSGSIPLMGGMILKWGSSSWPGQNGYVNFVSSFPNSCFMAMCQNAISGNNNTYINVTAKDPDRFQVYSPNNSGGSNLFYIAIGN